MRKGFRAFCRGMGREDPRGPFVGMNLRIVAVRVSMIWISVIGWFVPEQPGTFHGGESLFGVAVLNRCAFRVERDMRC